MLNAKLIIARLLGFRFVTIGHEGTPSETPFQRQHKDWLDKVELDEVGNYFVNVEKDIWYHSDEVDFEGDYNWLNRAMERLYEEEGVDIVITGHAVAALDKTGERILFPPVYINESTNKLEALVRTIVKAAILTDAILI